MKIATRIPKKLKAYDRGSTLEVGISHGFNDINIKSIMTVLDNKPLTNAHINKTITK